MPKMIEVAFDIGDAVYVIKDGKIHKMSVCFIYINKDGTKRYHARDNETKFNFREKGIGRDVFEDYGDALIAACKMARED